MHRSFEEGGAVNKAATPASLLAGHAANRAGTGLGAAALDELGLARQADEAGIAGPKRQVPPVQFRNPAPVGSSQLQSVRRV